MHWKSRVFSIKERKAKRVICAVFGDSQILMGLFERAEEVWYLNLVRREPLTEPLVPGAAADSIRDFLKRAAAGAGPGIIVSWRADLVEKPVFLPEISDAEVNAAVRFKMEHHFKMRPADYLYDWIPSEEVLPAHGRKARQYFVYAMKKSETEPFLRSLGDFSRRLLSIVPTSAACAAAACFHDNGAKDTAVLHIDSEMASFQVCRHGRPLLSRQIRVGGISDPQSAREAGREDERLVPAGRNAASRGLDVTEDEEFLRITRPKIEALQTGVRTAIEEYHRQNYSDEIGRVVLCENTPQTDDLDRSLEFDLEIPVKRPPLQYYPDLYYAPGAEDELRRSFSDFLPMIGAFLVWRFDGPNLAARSGMTRPRTGVFWLAAALAALAAAAAYWSARGFFR